MKNQTSHLDSFALHFSRMGFAGLSPIMPGTCGTALSLALAPWFFLPLPIWGRCAALLTLFIVGGFLSTRAERLLERKDPGSIVVDEWLGMWLTLLPLHDPSWASMGIAFVLFRIFDMVKPWPIRLSETWLPKGFGIMIDDVVAAIYALILLGGLHIIWGLP